MVCLIEGHDTHPVDIERALKDDYSADNEKRNLQLEAKAHIAVQEWIDEGGLRKRAATHDGICEINRRFCERLPDDLLWVDEPESGERTRVVPGELRQRDVKVGRHITGCCGFIRSWMAMAASHGSCHIPCSWIHWIRAGSGL